MQYNIKSIIIALAVTICYSGQMLAQKHDVTTVNDKEFYIYYVQQGQGFYSICTLFNVEKGDIIKYNPYTKNGLTKGQRVLIPINDSNRGLNGEVATDSEKSTPVANTTTQTPPQTESVVAPETIPETEIVTTPETVIETETVVTPETVTEEETVVTPGTTPQAETITQTETVVTPDTTPQAEIAVTPDTAKYIYHEIMRRETFYSLSREYNVPIDMIKEANNITTNMLNFGDIIKIPVLTSTNNKATTEVAEVETKVEETTPQKVKEERVIAEFEANTPQKADDTVTINGITYRKEKYEVKRKETLYSISQKFKTTVDNILAANPNIKKLSNNDIIYIPMTNEVISVVDDYRAANHELSLTPIAGSASDSTKVVNIAVLMPFSLDLPTAASQRYISYYKGVLLALDSLKQEGLSANVYVHDTKCSVDTLKNILQTAFNDIELDFIFTSGDNSEINLISNYTTGSKTAVVNSFSVNNNDILTNKNIFQGHIPSLQFNPLVAEGFVGLAEDREIYFLSDNNEENNKVEICDLIKSELKLSLKEYSTFSFNEIEDFTVLSDAIPRGGSAIFVATSSTRSGVAKSTAIIKKLTESRPDIDITLFGYPEWQIYINDYAEIFHSLNTVFYSRFYINSTQSNYKVFNTKYQNWFGFDKSNALPAADILGYDTALFMLKEYNAFGDDFTSYLNEAISESVQTDFDFAPISDNGGYINTNIYSIKFTPDYNITKERFKR